MMRHLNSLNYFSLGIESLWTNLFMFGWDVLTVTTLKVKGQNVFKVSIRLSNSTQTINVNLFDMNSIEIIYTPREIV